MNLFHLLGDSHNSKRPRDSCLLLCSFRQLPRMHRVVKANPQVRAPIQLSLFSINTYLNLSYTYSRIWILSLRVPCTSTKIGAFISSFYTFSASEYGPIVSDGESLKHRNLPQKEIWVKFVTACWIWYWNLFAIFTSPTDLLTESLFPGVKKMCIQNTSPVDERLIIVAPNSIISLLNDFNRDVRVGHATSNTSL